MKYANRGYRSAIMAFVLLWFIWGYSWVVMKRGLQFAGPIDFAMLRTLVGTITLFTVLIVLRKPLWPQAVGGTVILGLFQTSGNLVLMNSALAFGGAGKVSVLCFTMPFWTLLLARIFLGEKIRGLQWLAVLLAFAGLVLIVEPWRLHATFLSEILAVCGGISWAASAIVAKQIRARHDLQLLSLTAWQMLFGFLPLLAMSLIVPSRPIEWSGYFIFSLLFAGMLATGAGWLLWLYVLNHLPAGTASLNALAIPAIAVLAAWLELGEKPSSFELSGMLCIAVALAVIAATAMRQHIEVNPEMAQE